MKFDFRNTAPVRYRTGRSGFVTEAERRLPDEERLRIPELSSAFFPHFWLTEADFTALGSDCRGAWVVSDVSAEAAGADGFVPLIFRAELDCSGAGNYRVTLTIDNTDGEEDELLIFITRRRLYGRVTLRAGEIFTHSYDCNVCEFIPRGYKNEFDGTTVDIAVVGKKPRLTELEIERLPDAVPTVWIAGDSTLTDQSCAYPYCPSTSYSGWGQMLSAFLENGTAVSNHAHSGLTTQSFRAGGHHAIVQRHIRKGDFFLMQFAHNDQKAAWLTAEGGYRERIVEYIGEVREAEAYPIIVTPLARNSWRGDGEYNDLLFEYDRECKRIGEEYGVPVIGLHDFMMNTVKAEGLESSKRYYYPGDFTHTNDPGAYMCARYIASELSRLSGEGYARLASLVSIPEGEWEAPRGIKPPAPPADFKVSDASAAKADTAEDKTPVTRAEAADILIKAAHFFTVNVYNDMFSDILGHEWHAGAVECAYQNGLIPTYLAAVGGSFRPDEEITLGDFAVMAVLAYASRNKLPRADECPLDGACEPWRLPYIRGAYAIGIITDADLLTSAVTRSRAAKIVEIMAL